MGLALETESRYQRYIGGGIPCAMHDSTITSPSRTGAGFIRSLNPGGMGFRFSATDYVNPLAQKYCRAL